MITRALLSHRSSPEQHLGPAEQPLHSQAQCPVLFNADYLSNEQGPLTPTEASLLQADVSTESAMLGLTKRGCWPLGRKQHGGTVSEEGF